MIRTLPVLAMLALTACIPATDPPPVDEDACLASGSRNLVGQSADILAAMTFPIGTRIITPGLPVTMDYSATRLNIAVGRTNRIEDVYCG